MYTRRAGLQSLLLTGLGGCTGNLSRLRATVTGWENGQQPLLSAPLKIPHDLIGNPSLHPEVGQAIEDVHGMIAGKPRQPLTMLANGGVRVKAAERTFSW